MFLRTMSILLVGFVLGCGDELPNSTPPNTQMTTEGFDKTCSTPADCILVYTGNVCGCGCTQDAISMGEASRYAAAEEEKRKACTDVLSCQPCPETQMAACTTGTCAVVAK